MIDPRDVAATAAAVASEDGHEGRTYELTGPEPVTFSDVAAQLSEVAGRPVGFVPVPDAAALEGLRQAGLPGWMAENIVAVFGMLRDDPSAQVTDAVPALTGGRSWPTTRPCSRPDRRGADYGPVLGGRFAAPTSGLSADGPPARSGR